MPVDILTQRPAEQQPALNTESDLPARETKPDADTTAPTAETTTEAAEATTTETPAQDKAEAKGAEGKKADAPAPSEDQEEEARVKQKPWFQKRIDELTRQRHEAERKLQTESEARARLEAEVAARTPPPPPKPEDDPEPAKAEFPDPDAYTDARARWAARQEYRAQQAEITRATNERRAADQQANVQKYIDNLHSAHNQRIEKAKTELPDFEKVALREDLTLPFGVFAEIERSDLGPQVMYAIGKKPEMAKELTAMFGNPQSIAELTDAHSRVARKLVEIEGVIKAERTRTVTKATEPIEPLGGRGTAGPKEPEDETMQEYAKRREQELAKSNTRRGMAVRRST